MTLKELEKKQDQLREMIHRVADTSGLVTDDIYPIFDGICDEAGYLKSKLRVAWILKEPYDDFDKSGKPCGGGWSLVKDCFGKQDAWRNVIWQKIAYVMYGFNHNLKWEDMDYIRDNHSMIDEMKSIAYINLSNYKTYWKDVVAEQLKAYDPEVIIFGYTFGCMKESFLNVVEDAGFMENVEGWVRYWRYFNHTKKQILLDTYHPGRKGGKYVNSLIEALDKAFKELKA